MAVPSGKQTPDLKQVLLEQGHRFSFIQAYRILQYLVSRPDSAIQADRDIRKNIRVRPDLSLEFPESDILSIEEVHDLAHYFSMTVTFLGLYGTSSPLPTFYTEDLLDEQSEDMSVTRDFIDIINSPLYAIVFRIWGKHRLFYTLAEKHDTESIERMFCLLGLENETLRNQIDNTYSLLRYIGLAIQSPRSAEGLRALLSDAFQGTKIEVNQCIPRHAVLPEDQRCRLGISGNRLGTDCFLGEEVTDRMGKFTVAAGPVGSDMFHKLLPDTAAFTKMNELIRFYVDQPLLWDINIFVNTKTIRPARLGGTRWSQLGWNTWLNAGNAHTGSECVTFPVKPA